MISRSLHITIGLLLTGASALAQYSPPAGNAHPGAQALTDTGSANPFGEPSLQSASTIETKHAFAERVDLSPLRDLAVFNQGRVKVFDTLARETVKAIAGRSSYLDLAPVEEGGRHKKLRYDPLFTLLDIIIDPAYYNDKALIHVEYLPLRRAFVEAQFESKAEQERWMKLTRLSPDMIRAQFASIAERDSFDEKMARGLQSARNALLFLQIGHDTLRIVAPTTSDGQWLDDGALSPDSPVRKILLKLGIAWRHEDAQRVYDAAVELAQALPAINSAQYPKGRRRLEAIYNAAHPFEYGYWAYCLSLITLLLAFGTGRKWLIALGVTTLAAAVALHAFGFASRWYIAERLPIQNQFESMTGLALGGALVGFVIMLLKRQWLFGAASAAVGFLVLITATTTRIPGAAIGREAAILNTSVLLKYHVTTVLVSYGMITLGFIVSLFYLWTHYAGRRRAAGADAMFAAEGLGLDAGEVNVGAQRVLRDLDRAQMTILQLAFWALGVGILLGAWWADHSWGRWWAFDPKETWALLTWIIYLIVVHLRHATGARRGLVTAWMSVAGFIVMLWTYFGVNLILPGLHAYA